MWAAMVWSGEPRRRRWDQVRFSPRCPPPSVSRRRPARGDALFPTESPTPRAGPGTRRCSRDAAGRWMGERLSSSTRLPEAPTAASEDSGSQFQAEQSPASHACVCGQTSPLESTRSACQSALCSARHGGALACLMLHSGRFLRELCSGAARDLD